MAWRIVKQPDGRYARFSEIVDNFTHVNMTRAEAVDLCVDYMGRAEAEQKVKNSETTRAESRWTEALRIIRSIHGTDAEKVLLKDMKIGSGGPAL